MSAKRQARFKIIALVAVGTVTLIALVAGIIIWQVVDWDKDDSDSTPTTATYPEDDYILEPSDSILGMYGEAAVATDAPYCSEIGKNMFEKGGNVADAAIAAMLCVGVVQTQSMGLGGGFLLVMYNATDKTSTTLNARDRAPLKADRDMFEGKPEEAARGELSIAVPGELKGYWELWRNHGVLDWKELFEPTILLARDGFTVTRHAAGALFSNSDTIKNSETLREIFIDPATQEVYKEGDIMRRLDLAATLQEIADVENPEVEGDVLYRETDMMRKFVEDIAEQDGIITEDDMLQYEATWDPPVKMDIAGGFTVHSIPPPGSGILLAFFMKLLGSYAMDPRALVTYQRMTEAFKHGYAKRTLLGDPENEDEEVKNEIEELYKNLTSISYINSILPRIFDDETNQTSEYYGAEFYKPEDHGTSHLCILAPNGDAIAVTSTINLYFGSQIRSKQTGIIYNDMMDDFSSPNVTNSFDIPPSKNNFIKPRKRPVSSMTPAIFTDEQGRVRLVVGGAGGSKITTAVAQVAIRNLWFGESIKEAIDARRIHHQIWPMEVQYEDGSNPRFIAGLRYIGHNISRFNVGTSVVQGIARAANGTVFANSDFRKRGTVAGF